VLQCNYIRQFIDLLEGLIPKRDDNKEIQKDHLEKLILFAIMWALGALLEQGDRKKVHYNFQQTSFTLTIVYEINGGSYNSRGFTFNRLYCLCILFDKFTNTEVLFIDMQALRLTLFSCTLTLLLN